MDEKIAGTCRCGTVAFEVDGRPLITMACHCRECQHMTGSAFSLSSLYLSDRFRVTAGTPVARRVGQMATHHFCPDCASWLFTRPDGMDELVNVRATLLADAAGFRPFIETWTADKLPWVTTPATHSYPGFPPMEAYPALLAEFAGGTTAPRP
ncbi:GFA family protein [Tistrella mobilis]|jgi:hypothetical protein|uniref:GFA family protein n=1 Tax=Tistrella mobilis TaxID=171437 RepID=UPI003555E4FD